MFVRYVFLCYNNHLLCTLETCHFFKVLYVLHFAPIFPLCLVSFFSKVISESYSYLFSGMLFYFVYIVFIILNYFSKEEKG